MFLRNNFQIIKIFPQEIWNLAQVKNYMRIEADYDDDLIRGLIDTAITAAENFTKLNFVTKQIKFTCNVQNKYEFLLKYQPLQEIIRIMKKHKKQDDKLNSDDYFIDENTVILKRPLAGEELIIEYISGYDGGNIPPAIKHGIMLHVTEMYDRQANSCAGLSLEVQNLYLPYRNIRI